MSILSQPDKFKLFLLCVARAGSKRGARIYAFIEDWAAAVEANRGPVSMNHYANWTRRYSGRTAYVRLAEFRAIFPELGPDGQPAGLMGPLLDRLSSEAESGT
jgi:hypothetical protein